MKSEPQKEHHWLARLVGEWAYEHEAAMEPGKPPAKFAGTETVRLLGGLWAVCEGQGDMPGGGTANTIMTLGYDPAKKRYQGTFIGSMMTHLWVYEGELDSAGKVLTLNTEGPDFSAEGKTTKYRDMIEFTGDDHRMLISQMLGGDGTWHEIMRANYRRTR